MTANEVQAIITEADLNGDGKLDYAEFCHMLSSTSEQCVHANSKKVLQARQHHSNKFKSPSTRDVRRKGVERREQRREEIRRHLYSPQSERSVGGERGEGALQEENSKALHSQVEQDPPAEHVVSDPVILLGRSSLQEELVVILQRLLALWHQPISHL